MYFNVSISKALLLGVLCFAVGAICMAAFNRPASNKLEPSQPDGGEDFQVLMDTKKTTLKKTECPKSTATACPEASILDTLQALGDNEALQLQKDGRIHTVAVNTAKGDGNTQEPTTSDMNKKPEKMLTREDIKEMVPEGYERFFAPSQPVSAEEFDKLYRDNQKQLIDFNKDSIDEEWSLDAQQKIKDYIYSHRNAAFIELPAVICKRNECRIFGRNTRDNYDHNIILEELKNDRWLKSNLELSTTLTTMTEGNKKTRPFHVLLKRKT